MNVGYDNRSTNTGDADTGLNVTKKRDAFLFQVAAGLDAVSETWNFNAYALVPIVDVEYRLKSDYKGGALYSSALDVGYSINPDCNVSDVIYFKMVTIPFVWCRC